MTDTLLFVVFPYAAVLLAIVVSLSRYRSNRFSYSSLSSQILETRQLFWGSVAWHYSIGLILLAHLLAALFPGAWASLLGSSTRLYVMEISGLALALLAIFGVGMFVARRLSNRRVRAVSSVGDWVLLVALLAQVVIGFGVALTYRWGSAWYVQVAAPWLASLVKFNPQVQSIAPLPWLVKLHFLGGFVILALFPFTRLVHAVTLPLGYLWRPYQLVVWNRRRGSLKRMP